jgi:electron transfer flavoprotein alpha subunit
MSVLVLVENMEGSFKKKSFELVQYAAKVAADMGTQASALVLGTCGSDAMAGLGAYGAAKVLHVSDSRLDKMSARAYTKAVVAAAQQSGTKVIIASHDVVGKSVAPQVASRLKAGLAAGAVSYPDTSNGFVVKRNVFAGKAFAFVNISSDVKVLTLLPNSFQVTKAEGSCPVEALSVSFDDKDFAARVKEVNKVSGSVPLSEAELVVSGGRGLKGPENWGVIEDLAATLGAATACSRPVADSHWRPHHEHVGQTGGTIRPNLYIAIGISGAIQHLAGVNGSKTIVVINKDPEAPFFKAADYGVIGDALEVTPKLNEAVKRFKASQH